MNKLQKIAIIALFPIVLPMVIWTRKYREALNSLGDSAEIIEGEGKVKEDVKQIK